MPALTRQIHTAAELSWSDARRVLKTVLNYPVFVPNLGADITRFLVDGRLDRFIAELDRLAALGSAPASSLLGYLYLRGAFEGGENPIRAQELCTKPAQQGDAYAQYVMAWICRAKGEEAEAMNWLRRSVNAGLFPPAFVDIARFMIGGIGVASPDTRAALAVLWDAHRIGHRLALVYISQALRRTSKSLPMRVAGLLLYPIAIARASLFARRWPLSDRAFVHSASLTRPLFKAKIMTANPDHGGSLGVKAPR